MHLLDISLSPRRPSLGRGFVHFLAVGMMVACNPSQGQTPGVGTTASAPSLESAPGGQDRLPPRGEAWVIFGSDTIRSELARTPEEREEGLMFRETLEEGRGMLFVFPDSQIRSFWMRNTLIPLDIAYMDESLRIVDIQAMDPQTEDAHPSARPAMFALEVPQGWFRKMGIEVGHQAQVVFGPG